jgi:lipoate-protein ligase B
VDTDRGGDITWHGPGQLVGYPILHLRRRGLRAADYVRTLEAALIDVLAEFEVAGEVVPGRPGVWVGDGKVAAIGVAIRGGVSTHGFALNVSPDLSWFDAITPCGLADATVTSLTALMPRPPSMGEVIDVARAALGLRLSSAFVAAPSPFVEAVPA